MIRRPVLVLPAVALTLTAAACTSSGGDGTAASSASSASSAPAASSGSGSSSASSSASTTVSTTPVTQPTSVPASVPNASGVIKGKVVSLTSCKATVGGWTASGTARPSAARKTAYTVTVFFTTNSATVQAFGQTKVSVATGKTAAWTVTSKFVAAPGTLCVLRGAG